MNLKLALALIFAFFSAQSLSAQYGVSSMSVGMSRSGLAQRMSDGRYRMLPAKHVRVEEYINYHRHDLPLPEGDDSVRLHIQSESNSKHSYVQFGLTTPRSVDIDSIPPLNLVLVIDQSGSMDGDRLAKVKEAILAFSERLREVDRLSICTFNTSAHIRIDGVNGSQQETIRRTVNEILAGGSTNLHAGLMLGYETARKHFNEEATNRVGLMTDGIANHGMTDLETIADQSKMQNKEGIDLSTIGLGSDLNVDLLRELADSGRGLAHFVGDAADIKKTFVSEIESLLAPAARRVKLVIDFGDNPLPKVYGYQPKEKRKTLVFQLDNLNRHATQVVMTRVKDSELSSITATLTFVDAITGEEVKIKRTLAEEKSHSDGDSDVSIKKNVAIAVMADSLKRAAVLSNDSECEEAEERLSKGIRMGLKRLGLDGDDEESIEDEDVERIVDIVKNYRKEIRACIARGMRD